MSLSPELLDVKPRRAWVSVKLVAVIAAAVAVVWSTKLFVDAWQATHSRSPRDGTFIVTGSAARHAMPKAVQWDITVTTRGSDRAHAIHDLVRAADRTIHELLDHGIAAGEVIELPSTCEAEKATITHHLPDGSETSEDVARDFVASQIISVSSRDVARVLGAYRTLAAAERPLLDVGQPVCTLENVTDELLTRARLVTRASAEQTAAVIGAVGPGKLISAEPATNLPLNEAPLTVCIEGADITAGITATYALE
jgi:hypothetical protein